MTQTINESPTIELPTVPPSKPSPPRRRLSGPWWYTLSSVGAIALAVLLIAGGLTLYPILHRDRIYQGVTVAGVPLGGLTRERAQARLEERATTYRQRPATAQVPDGTQRWQITPDALGVRFETGAAVDRALATGRDGGVVRNTWTWLNLLLPGGGRDLPLPATVDRERVATALRGWAPVATRWPVDASLAVDTSGDLTIVPDQPGLGFALDADLTAFQDHASHLSGGAVVLPQAPVPAAISAEMLRQHASQTTARTSQPLVVSANGRTWALDIATLRHAYQYRLVDQRLVVVLDRAALQPFLETLGRDVADQGRNARIVVNAQGQYAIEPERTGALLDETATVATMEAALNGDQHQAAVKTRPLTPPIVASDLETIRARAERIAAMPLVVSFGAYRRTFVRSDLQPLIIFTEQPERAEKVAISLDPKRLRGLTAIVASDLKQDLRDAQFRYLDGAVREVVSSQEGRAVQFDPTDAALSQAILGASGQAQAVVTVTKPAVTSADIAQIVVPDRLAFGQTDYSFSIPSRKHNVELAMSRLNGALIPPNATFSFNQTVGEQTVANGYQPAYGIALVAGQGGGPGQVKTVSSIGGGICQVATTLFHGAFRAGLPIEERNWHLYWIPGYGVAPSGMQGLDATVDDQSGLDLKFRNTTGNWIAIQAVADGKSVRITLYGKNPGWNIQIDQPVITNVQVADQTPVREKTHDLPPGQQVMVEHAVDGFDAAIHIRVTDRNGAVLRDVTFKSSYRPSRNVYQVGVPPNEPIN